MDNCFVDVTIEFLSVAFHNILHYSSIYPDAVFETRRKYSIVVYTSVHPEINKYIELCLKTIAECLKSDSLTRIEFALTDAEYKPVIKYVFEFERICDFDETLDAYLVQCEQNMRAFCLCLASTAHKLKKLPEDASFSILVHTTESNAVSLAINPALEEFPMIEVKEIPNTEHIVPIRQFAVRNYNIATYVEM